MDKIYLFFAINYFAQGMSGIIFEPVSYLLKDNLNLSAGESSTFIFWMTLPFLLKPLFGALTDLVAFKNYRRKPHLMLVAALAGGALLVLAAQRQYGYALLLGLLVLFNVGLVYSDVVCDAVMIEQGKEDKKTGLYQAVQIGTLYATLVLTGLGGGWLTAHVPTRWIFALAASFPLLILASSHWIREPQVEKAPSRFLAGFNQLLAQKRFWMLSLFIFLWSFSPFLGTAQFYYQSDFLKLTPVFIGFLSTLGGVAGVLGASFYGKVVGRKWSTDAVVRASVLYGAPLSLLYFFYLGPGSAAFVTVFLGFTGVAFRLALMDLAAQSCPTHAEAAAFAVYMSVFNLAASASNTLGGNFYDALSARYSPYGAMVALSLMGSFCTLACWRLLPYVSLRDDAARA